MKPTENRLLVRVEVEEVKEGEQPKGNQTMIAEVLAVGPECKQIVVGDRVGFSPYGFDEVMINNKTTGVLEKLVVVSEMMILGVYEK